MAGEVLVTNAGWAVNSGLMYRNSSRITLDGSMEMYMYGNAGEVKAQIYDNIFTDNNLNMRLFYAITDSSPTWYLSNEIAWEAVNGTAARQIGCAAGDVTRLRWRCIWIAVGGDGKTYVDYSWGRTFSAYSLGATATGKKLYKLGTAGGTTTFGGLWLVSGTLLKVSNPDFVVVS